MCLAIPAKIVELFPEEKSRALVEVVGVRRHIDIGLLEDQPLATGDWVLIHVGFAMSRVDEEEALATRRQLVAMGKDYEQELEELKASVIE